MIEDADKPARGREVPAAVPVVPRISSAELFRGQRWIVIVHRGQEYRLQITKGDKLILTK